MGKNKIKIEKVQNERGRQVTFYKRRKGLIKKAMELSILCDSEVMLFVYNKDKKDMSLYSSNEDMKKIGSKLLSQVRQGNCEEFSNLDYNNDAKKKNTKKSVDKKTPNQTKAPEEFITNDSDSLDLTYSLRNFPDFPQASNDTITEDDESELHMSQAAVDSQFIDFFSSKDNSHSSIDDNFDDILLSSYKL